MVVFKAIQLDQNFAAPYNNKGLIEIKNHMSIKNIK